MPSLAADEEYGEFIQPCRWQGRQRRLLEMHRRKKVLITGITILALSAIGVAIAAWTTGGSGSGQASAGTALSMSISAGTPSSNLYPTGSADVAAVVSNPNPYMVHVSSIALGAVTVDAGHSGCNT